MKAGSLMNKAPYGSPAVEYARRAVGGGTEGDRRIELMEAEGDGRDGRVVLRISSAFEPQGWDSGSQATACYRYDLNETGIVRPDETRCPDSAPLELPPPPFDPSLPPDVLDRLDAALRAADPAAAARESLAAPGLTASAHRAPAPPRPGLPCRPAQASAPWAGARRTAPSPPGTSRRSSRCRARSCDPVAAAAGLGARAPH